jgi:beta-fructofuranosidase
VSELEHWTKDEKNQVLKKSDEERLNKLHDEIAQSIWRAQYHIQAVTGLLNDPNGFCWFKKQWHLFYQWFPFGAVHGTKHWYHTVSHDLIHWQNLGMALEPDLVFDNAGCFSGSAFPKDDYLYLLYTGNHKENDGHRIPYQMIAAMNAKGYVTKLKHPIIEPNEAYTEHQRDPKIFYENGSYWMLIGAQDHQQHGHLILYKSRQIAIGWEFAGELKVKGYPYFGTMAECPDIEKIGDQWLLLFSPQGYAAKGDEFRNAYQNVYLIGDLDLNALTFVPNGPYQELDRGFDFYAAQCASQYIYKNTAVMVGWLGCGDCTYPATDEEGWSGMLSLPRELTIEDGKLRQNPIRTSEQIKGEKIFEALHGSIMTDTMHGRTPAACVMHVDDPDDNAFELGLYSQTLKKGFSIVYEPNHKYFTIDRGDLENQCNTMYGTDRRIKLENGLKSLEIFVDHSTVEIFINHGEYVMSSRIFPKPSEHLIRMRGKDISLIVWKANSTVADDFKI